MIRSPQIRICLVLLALLVAADAFAQAVPGRLKLDKALRTLENDGKPRVIVQYRDGAGDRVRRRAEARGAKVRRTHESINAITIEVDGSRLEALAGDPDVLRVSLDAVVHANARGKGKGHSKKLSKRLLKTATTTMLRQIVGAPATLNGEGVGVAIIDSGIALTPDLKVHLSLDFTGSGGPIPVAPSDAYGHGTHLAGLIAGNGLLSDGKYAGIAPGVRLYSFKVLDHNGQGYTSDVIEAIDVAARHPEYIQIINLSLGHPIYESPATDPLVQAVERAARQGVLVVVSAGNYGYDWKAERIGYAGITSPGNAPSALTVGSIGTRNTISRLDDTVSFFSSRGPTWFEGRIKPDVVAPGENLVAISTVETKLYGREQLRADIEPYLRLSGTSMATAVVSGVVALIMQANQIDEGPGKPLTPNAIKAIVQYTAIPVPDRDPSTPDALEQGAGGLNADGAIALARAIEPSAPLGAYWLETPLSSTSIFDGILYPWSQHIVWGDHLVWGDVAYFNLVSWDEHIVWGDHILWGEFGDEHIVWGDVFDGTSIVAESFYAWSTQIVWGDHLVWGDMYHIVWGDLLDEHIVWGDILVDLIYE